MRKVNEAPYNMTPMIVGIGFMVAGMVAYLYFLNLSVVHVVMRKEATQEQSQLRAEISMLETKYIEAQHSIAARIATLDGYSIDTDKIFVNRGDTSLVLNNN